MSEETFAAGEPSSRAILAWIFNRLQAARAFHHALRASLFTGGILLALLAYLWIFGLPARFTRIVADRLSGPALDVSIERLWVDPLEGLKARNLVLLPGDTNAAGPLAAGDVSIDLNWLNLLAGGPWLDAMHLHGGRLTVRLPAEFGTNGLPCDFVVSNVTLHASATWQMFRLDKLSAEWPGGIIEGRGLLAGPPARGKSTRGSMLDDWMQLQGAVTRSPAWARELYQHLSAVHPFEPVRLKFGFSHHSAAPDLQTIQIEASGGAAVCQGVRIDGWYAAANVATGRLTVPRMELRSEGRICRIDGSMNLANRLVELHALNELPPSHWRDLLPASWLADLGRRPMRIAGKLRSEIWIPPTPLAQFGERWHGNMTWESARYREVTLEQGRMTLERDNSRFLATAFAARASRDRFSGPVAGDLFIDLSTGVVTGALQTCVHPDLFAPWLPLPTVHFLERFRFGPDAPSFAGTFSAGGSTNATLAFAGRLTGTNFSYRNTEVLRLDTGVRYGQDTLHLDPFHVTRSDGRIDGNLHLELAAGRYHFDLQSDVDPIAAGRLVSSNLERAIRTGHYSGQAQIHARGVYDEQHPGRTEIFVDVEAQRPGLRWFVPDTAVFTLVNEGHHYRTTNLLARAFGTELRGRLFVYPAATNRGGDLFELDLDAPDADFKALTLARRPDATDPPGGSISLKLQLAGQFVTNFAGTLKGEGRLAITNSQLSRVALLGGLSSLLAKVHPDLGYAAQTELFMDFEIRDGVLSSTNVRIGGALLSAKAKGRYDIAKDELDFIVEAQLLRKGTVADALRFITLPVTKLFQFELKGSLEKPEWRTANLPGIF